MRHASARPPAGLPLTAAASTVTARLPVSPLCCDRAAVLNELRLLASLRSPNVIGYHEAFASEQGQLSCVLELTDGGDLQGVLADGEWPPLGCCLPKAPAAPSLGRVGSRRRYPSRRISRLCAPPVRPADACSGGAAGARGARQRAHPGGAGVELPATGGARPGAPAQVLSCRCRGAAAVCPPEHAVALLGRLAPAAARLWTPAAAAAAA